MRRAILLVGFLGICVPAAAFQGVAVQRTSETMQLNVPPVVAQGSPATVSGVIPTKGRPTNVTIQITPPSGAPISLSASTNDKGEFTAAFTGTGTAGKYQVSVASANGASSSNATFTIIALSDVIASVTHEVQQLQGIARQLEGNAEQGLATLPPSSQKQTIMANLAQFRADLDQEDKLWAPGDQGLPYALNLWSKQVQTRPDAWAKAAPLFGMLLTWTYNARARHQKIVDIASKLPKLSNRSSIRSEPDHTVRFVLAVEHSTPVSSLGRAAGGYGKVSVKQRFESVSLQEVQPQELDSSMLLANCDSTKDFGDAFELAGTALTFVGGPMEIAVELSALVVGSNMGETGALATSGISKEALVLAEGGHHGLVNLGKFIVDAIPSLLKAVTTSCDFWEGPFSALTETRANNRFGYPWWVTNVFIEGKLSLRIAKDCPGPPYARKDDGATVLTAKPCGTTGSRLVHGEFEGMATRLDVWERALSILSQSDSGRFLSFGEEFNIAFHKLFPTTFVPSLYAFSHEQTGWKESLGGDFAGYRAKQEAAVRRGPYSLEQIAADFGASFPAQWSTNLPIKLPGGSFVNGLLTPTSFRVPVKGTLQGGDKLTLRLQTASWDIGDTDTEAHAKYLLINVSGGLPTFQLLDIPMPYTHARKILARAMGDQGDDPLHASVQVVLEETPHFVPEVDPEPPVPLHSVPDGTGTTVDGAQQLPYCYDIGLSYDPDDPGSVPPPADICLVGHTLRHGTQVPPMSTPPPVAHKQPQPAFLGVFTPPPHTGMAGEGATVANYALSFEICSPACEDE